MDLITLAVGAGASCALGSTHASVKAARKARFSALQTLQLRCCGGLILATVLAVAVTGGVAFIATQQLSLQLLRAVVGCVANVAAAIAVNRLALVQFTAASMTWPACGLVLSWSVFGGTFTAQGAVSVALCL